MRNKLAKNSIAVGLVTLIVTAGLSFSAQGAPGDPVAQATASAAQGTGVFEPFSTGVCSAVFPDGTPTGPCGPGVDTNQIDAFSQDATANAAGESTAAAAVGSVDLDDLGTALDLSDLALDLSQAELENFLGPILTGLGDILVTLEALTETVDTAIRPVLDGLQGAIPVFLRLDGITAECRATPDTAVGDSTIAGVDLVIVLGDEEIVVPLDLDTAPNSPLLVTAPRQLLDAILTGNAEETSAPATVASTTRSPKASAAHFLISRRCWLRRRQK